jgi:hypothetical protein
MDMFVLLIALPSDDLIRNSSFRVPNIKSLFVLNQVIALSPSLAISLSKASPLLGPGFISI